MRRRPPTRAVAASALALVAFSAASATPCAVCSCAALVTPVEAAADADAVFVGRFTGTREPMVSTSSADLVAKRFEVQEVRKGEVAAVTEVLTAASGASCGLEVEQGRTYVVVARATEDGLRADLCGGTREHVTATGDLDLIGPARTPTGGERTADVPLVAAGARDVLGTPVLWGPVAAASALVTLGLLALRRRRPAR
jgi:hypothetical protein